MTQLCGVIGNPIGHSASPAIHQAMYRVEGREAIYGAHVVVDADTGLDELRAAGYVGVNVTVPHKEAALAYADVVDATAARVGAANTLEFGDGVTGHNTDVAGAVRALESVMPTMRGARVLLLGAGGAARAVMCALHDLEVASVVVSNRTRARAESMPAEVSDTTVIGWAAREGVQADIVVNATSIGLDGSTSPIDPGAVNGCRAVLDLVYSSAPTPLVAAARSQEIQAADGMEMLIEQAAAAYEIFWGSTPTPAMLDAARHAVGR